MANFRVTLVALLVIAGGGAPAWAQQAAAVDAAPLPERQAELHHRLRHDCGSCHGMTLKGGLGPSLLPAALADKDDAALVDIILHGVPGRPMPPWAFEISPAEAAWLVRRLKQGMDDAG
jgi:cytochrome c55X